MSTDADKVSSRTGRSSRELPRFSDKDSADYEAAVDREKSEYVDEAEEESGAGPGNKGAVYKGSEFRVGEDSNRFIDQEERSSLYDDFEAKDIAKRGISGADDYEEEVDDEDVAALDERESMDEEAERRKARGDVRVKREHEKLKEAEKAENAETSLKEEQPSKTDTESNEQIDQSKRNVEKPENELSKANDQETDQKQSLTVNNDQSVVESNENAKLLNGEATGGRKMQEEVGSSSGESSSLEGASKIDEPKIVDVSSQEAAKVEAPPDRAEVQASENPASNEQANAEYEKRVEDQIQRKIDSIKEEIKREIAENERIKAIEENNAKFDEMRDREEDEEQPSEKSLSKRSLRKSSKSEIRNSGEKRSIKRKKRQNENSNRGKVRNAGESNSNDKKSIRGTVRKRSIGSPTSPNKREFARQVFLVRNDRDARNRERRSRNSLANREDQRSFKLNLPADVALDLKARGDLGDAKSELASKAIEDERTMAEQESLSDRKSGSVASLNSEENGPLATEYGDAFGSLHGESGVALARFKRIKRVLPFPASKT
ncbi:transcriptional regulator ATRX homolog [Colletes gigas]|uniref:transcriptional regulator ATRX homolog n=1 Tax=Colletes gigas TaxID=935657 RepID=UPI001C9BA3AD|nr:transcriptional regulator ATRX homolog [Colletes gigas]